MVIVQNAVGLILEVVCVDENDVAINISAATTKDILIQRPNGFTITRAASFTTSGTDGKIRYITVAGDLIMAGRYKYQGHVVYSGNDRLTSAGAFVVEEALS